MAIDLGGLALGAGRALSGYGQGQLSAAALAMQAREEEQRRREAYAQRLHEIMLSHSLSRASLGGIGAVPLSQYSPELATELANEVPGTDWGGLPTAQAMQLAVARLGQRATGERQATTENFQRRSQATAAHRDTFQRAQRYAEGYAAQHADEVKATPTGVQQQINELLRQTFPTLTPGERNEIAATAVVTYRAPRKSFAEIIAEQLSREGNVPQGAGSVPPQP